MMNITEELNAAIRELDTLDFLEEEKKTLKLEAFSHEVDMILLEKLGDVCYCGCHAEKSLQEQKLRFDIISLAGDKKTLLNSDEFSEYLLKLGTVIKFYAEVSA